MWSFELGELVEIDPTQLAPATDVDRCFLALALLFNDLKDLVIIDVWLEGQRPEQDKPRPYAGQWAGIANHVRRLGASLLHEFLQLLKKHNELIGSEEFQSLVQQTPRWAQDAWKEFLLLAQAADDDSAKRSPLYRALRDIRNWSAFHYAQWKPLANAYRTFFIAENKDPGSSYAFVSMGKDMDAIRFYYADAAASSLARVLSEREQLDVQERVNDTMRQLNRALAPVISAYLRQKTNNLVPVCWASEEDAARDYRGLRARGGRPRDRAKSKAERAARRRRRVR